MISSILIFLFLSGLGAACQAGTSPSPLPIQATPTVVVPSPVATTAVPTPTLTPEPLALTINGEGISLAEYQADLAQLQEADQALGKNASAEEQRQQVLDDLTSTLLLAQAAVEGGYQLDDTALQAEMDRLSGKLGGSQQLQDWVTQHGYTESAFRSALKRQMAAAWQRDQIAAQVPLTAEQIHARQILTSDETIAQRALEQVKVPGVNFAAQALRYDPVTGGDLGWFPRGYLLQPEVEEAAFRLQPGEISPVIKSAVGYHIIQVIAREQDRPLSPDALRILQHKALQEWIVQRQKSSQVEVMLP